MKKIFSLFAMASLVLTSNCSQIPENNDPVLGLWSIESNEASNTAKNVNIKSEWTFNDAYLGRYRNYSNNTLTGQADFSWSYENGVYTIIYPTTFKEQETVSLEETNDGRKVLQDLNGNIIAERP